MPDSVENPFPRIVAERRATPSFLNTPVAEDDLQAILRAGQLSPSSFNLQPWRFIVVRSPEGRKRLRAASFNQRKIEEAPLVLVACGDADGWRSGDLEEMLSMGREGGMPESFIEKMRTAVPEYLTSHPNISAWLNRQVMMSVTTMMWMAETLGYDTAPMEGFDGEKVRAALKLPLSWEPIALLAIGRASDIAKYDGGRFSQTHIVFEEEYPKPLRSDPGKKP